MRMSRRLLLPLVVAALATPALAEAHDRPVVQRSMRPMVREDVTVTLEAADGMALPSVRHRGTTFVAGVPGERYMVRVTNNTMERIEVVVTVDGRDVLTGQLGNFVRQRGYVVDPMGTVSIDGFRRSLDHVAAFRFSDVHDSFAGRSGTPQHAGIVGVAVFKERVSHHHHDRPVARAAESTDEAAPRSSAPTKGGSARANRDMRSRQEIGTEFAETRVSRVREVSFVRRNPSRPDSRTALRYDTAQALVARGVPIDPVIADVGPVEVDAWPGARQFTAPPPRRRFR
jgi:hypothetical protein